MLLDKLGALGLFHGCERIALAVALGRGRVHAAR
jgi:hypothetical protein